MPEQRLKPRLSAAQISKRIALKKGVSRVKLRPAESTVVARKIYENSNATAVDRMIRGHWTRTPFSLINVEWIKQHFDEPISGGGTSIVFRGKVKFKGMPKALPVAIKAYEKGKQEKYTDFNEVLSRLSSSGVPHTKMVYLPAKTPQGRAYVVMEPFFQKRISTSSTSFLRESKFPVGCTISSLDLRNEYDKHVFSQALDHIAGLAKIGLYLGQSLGPKGFRTDVFTHLKLKNGEPKVYVQDIDTLKIGNTETDERVGANWSSSARVLFNTASDLGNDHGGTNGEIAKQMISEAAKKHGY